MRKTKIVITLGPSTSSLNMIQTLIERGVNVFRLNFSHGDHETHANNISLIRQASKNLGTEVAILQDISGPKVRIGKIDGVLNLNKGDTLTLSKEENEEDPYTLALSYALIIDMVNIGEEVFFADGTLQTVVIDKDENSLKLKLLNDGELTSRKGVNFPKTNLNISAITKKDEKDIAFGSKHDIDIVALSFVQNKKDILKAKQIMAKHDFDPFIVSKIETGESITNLEEILDVSDGVMVARGDLGAEFGVTKLPRIQKHIIAVANKMNKPSITATQMLTTMKDNPFPTRAEVSDIANAVYDGTDAVMLSDETTIGKFPIQSVEVLHDTIKDVEQDYPYFKDFKEVSEGEAVSKAAVELAKNLSHEALVPFTMSGMSAQTLSKYRPKQSIYAVSHSMKTHRQLSLVWGVRPLFIMDPVKNPTKLLYDFVKKILDEKRVSTDKRFIVTIGSTTGEQGSSNLIRLLNKEGMESVLASEF
ncbi:MAG: Pyruvate kinase (EC [uncultured Sulfurovum sp.]|uniref:Pyruvate kinase n=1 Tax=uncultured Sulfurovum sp. TaxID=269237 RepID=A0A6S6ST22_9BACT|nr:MAG: Pyruvate kinase (EC [uncultured Sulfurovum sp.]